MTDAQCVRFLQWALPQLRMRWDGFRKVRGQVKKRLTRRLRELGLPDIEAYRDYLRRHAGEWHKLDALCRITISRFYRDKGVYAALSQQVLPTLARAARQRRDKTLRVWSAGCGGGEEPYTISILWHLELRDRYPDLQIDIVATDADPAMLARAPLRVPEREGPARERERPGVRARTRGVSSQAGVPARHHFPRTGYSQRAS
jgi:chemotaxis protein methyltransferase CheR